MDMKVHCPGCGKSLRVPQTASGRRARCPDCQRVFRVPKPEDLVEETISTWIEEDLEELGEENEKYWEGVGSLQAYRAGKGMEKPRPGMRKELPPEPVEAKAAPGDASDKVKVGGNGDGDEHEHTGMSTIMAAMDDSTGVPAAEKSSGSAGARADSSASSAAGTGFAAAPAPALKPVAAPVAATDGAPNAPALTVRRSSTVTDETPYPNSLGVDPRDPHLVVVQCDQAGVQLAFDAIHLEHPGFRVSMPMCCAFSGMTERRKLYARPFAFVDRSSARIRSAQEVDVKHTVLVGNQAPADMLNVIGEIEQLPKPFNWPMPYYSGPDHSHMSLRCWTETRPEGGYTCFIVVPYAPVALQWLANVNGICGIEYAKLEYDVGLLENDAWRALGDECRRRLGVWCPFEAMEQFRTYISDGDFGSRDRGLAGLVFTDRRLLFCKYHHRGSVKLDEPGTLYIRDEGDFSNIAIENGDGRTRLVKLHLHDVPNLLKAMEPWTLVKIDRQQMPAPAST